MQEAIVERLNGYWTGDYGISDIKILYFKQQKSRRLRNERKGVMDFYKLKSGDYNQREGHCVVDWLYHHVKHSGHIISQKWYEKRFYDFCGKKLILKCCVHL